VRHALVVLAVAIGACAETPSSVNAPPGALGDAGAGDAMPDDAGTRDAAADGSIPPPPFPQSLVGTDVPLSRIGILYSVWHAPAATVQRKIAAAGKTPLAMEDVLRSLAGPSPRSFADIYPNGEAAAAMNFFWMSTPKQGFYCLYRKRAGETGLLPDCPDIAATLANHARELLAAGVDHVVVDASNLTGVDAASDELQIRPTEVLFEEWAALRASGRITPQIAVWNPIPTGATQWSRYMAVYADPKYEGLVLHDKTTGKKVFFVVDSGGVLDASTLAQIEADGGKNDVVVQRMWTLGATDAKRDKWAFMSPCRDGGHATTTPVGLASCDQAYTPASALGSAVAVSPSYQTGYASLPWNAAGKLSGITFQKEWATALAIMPKNVFVSGWNEFIAQPQPNPFTGDPFARSVGLERDPGGARLFVDTFGSELARDIEPTVQNGTADYDLLASCARVFRANAASGTHGCSMAGETCCDSSRDATYVVVLSLHDDGASDSLLTTSAAERASLVAAGAYREVCARYGTPSAFCVNASEPRTPFGPFVAFAAPGQGRQAIQRCKAGAQHFYSKDAACEGQTREGLLAYVADVPSSSMPRRLERCHVVATGEYVEALGAACPSGAVDEGTLGYVR
jgi:hypothetical protein